MEPSLAAAQGAEAGQRKAPSEGGGGQGGGGEGEGASRWRDSGPSGSCRGSAARRVHAYGGRRHEPQDRAQERETEGDGAAGGGERHGPEQVVHARVIGKTTISGAEPERVIFGLARLDYALRPQPSGPQSSGSVVWRGRSVADASHRLDQVLVLGPKLRPQAPDVNIDRSSPSVEVISPDLAKQGGSGADAAWSR